MMEIPMDEPIHYCNSSTITPENSSPDEPLRRSNMPFYTFTTGQGQVFIGYIPTSPVDHRVALCPPSKCKRRTGPFIAARSILPVTLLARSLTPLASELRAEESRLDSPRDFLFPPFCALYFTDGIPGIGKADGGI